MRSIHFFTQILKVEAPKPFEDVIQCDSYQASRHTAKYCTVFCLFVVPNVASSRKFRIDYFEILNTVAKCIKEKCLQSFFW